MNKQDAYTLNKAYKEILALDQKLTDAGIPHTMERFLDGWQVCYPERRPRRVMDAIERCGSYGCERDLLEIMGLLTEAERRQGYTVMGFLTADEVFARISAHYEAHREEVMQNDSTAE